MTDPPWPDPPMEFASDGTLREPCSTPYYRDAWLTVFAGDCRVVMASMEPESVHCVVTSPPYWGLRDYGTATWAGGDAGCDHVADPTRTKKFGNPAFNENRPSREETKTEGYYFDKACDKCGATRQDAQLGLEPTPEQYVANLVDVFREVRRVLRSDGTVWLNLGDSYSGSGPSGASYESETTKRRAAGNGTDGAFRVSKRLGERGLTYAEKKPVPPPGLKPKDLVGIPWRVAFALQADGWYLRSDIIWAKPNPMPESVTDRPTKSHEYLFLLSKSARYYYDADAVREGFDTPLHAPGNGHPETWEQRRGASVGKGMSGHLAEPDRTWGNVAGRNLRSVWTIATQPYAGSHFAVFPRKLVEPCIKAGSPPAGKRCDCDTPILTPLGSGEIVDPSLVTGRAGMNRPRRDDEGVRPITRREQRSYAEQLRAIPPGAARTYMTAQVSETTFAHYIRTDIAGARPIPPPLLADWLAHGWLTEPLPCDHPSEPPGVVLDPFAGSGTTGLVAQSLSRRAVLIDLNADYLVQAMGRNRDIPLGLVG